MVINKRINRRGPHPCGVDHGSVVDLSNLLDEA